ncbi:MAG: hypothetical protein ABWU13_19145 [Limnospira maxima]
MPAPYSYDLRQKVIDTKLAIATPFAAGDRPVVFRTLDLGGDKVAPYPRAWSI